MQPIGTRHAQDRHYRTAALQILDVTGPLEVFSSVAGYDVVLGSPDAREVLRTNRHVSLAPAVPLAHLDAPLDTLVIAGPGAESGTAERDRDGLSFDSFVPRCHPELVEGPTSPAAASERRRATAATTPSTAALTASATSPVLIPAT
ncbi:MAG: transcriptional regulator, AraC family [Candidatus Eremiobacteraeota bacterium]|nr:transcriptional regulator, AraC family [Candidatus Eremiobacteraeota bacterium]